MALEGGIDPAYIAQLEQGLQQQEQRNIEQDSRIAELESALEYFLEREERGEKLYGVGKKGKPKKGWGVGGFFYWGRTRPFPATFVASLLVRRVALKGIRAALKVAKIPTVFIGMFLMVLMPILYEIMRVEIHRQVFNYGQILEAKAEKEREEQYGEFEDFIKEEIPKYVSRLGIERAEREQRDYVYHRGH